MTPATAKLAATSVDVVAFNDVTIRCMTKPRTFTELREHLSDRLWNDGSLTEARWQSLYESYVHNFDAYLHDPEALNFRDQRRQRMTRTQREQPRRRRF